MFNFLFSLFSNDMGIDLGTSSILVYVKGQGIVLREPSVVAIEKNTKTIVAIGTEAKRMLGKTPANIVAVRPLRNGVIADFEVTETMIRYFIKKVHNRQSLLHPRIVIGVPSGITEVERRAVRESAIQAGAREVFLIEEPLAAAIGAEIPVQEPQGNMIVDIGGGTTEIAVLSLGGMVIAKSIGVAGDEMNEAIVQYFRKKYNLLVGENTAENVKIKIGSVFPLEEELSIEVKGRDQVAGLPKTIKVTSEEVRQALSEPMRTITELVKSTLEETPAELSADLVDRGIILSGGGALLRGMSELLSKETELPVKTAKDPLTCVVYGTGKYLEELDNLKRVHKTLIQ
ncbi:MAG: rod shape-determining protein [Elusimicrobia bacterium]|nr:rod shape-determining protein [Elusimicrobiota bacterium]MBU2615004.1 rod shape-determining protein [Elusimicrobiota bacterium]